VNWKKGGVQGRKWMKKEMSEDVRSSMGGSLEVGWSKQHRQTTLPPRRTINSDLSPVVQQKPPSGGGGGGTRSRVSNLGCSGC